MLSEASIASWCSPSQASPSYTPSRQEIASEALVALRSKSRLYTPLAPKFLASRLLVDLCFTNLCSQRRARRPRSCICDGAELCWLGLGFYMRLAGSGRLRAALYGMPPAAGDGGIHLNSAESPSVCLAGIIRSHRQLREANRQSHHLRSTPSIKGLPHTSHASSHHGPADRGPWGS